MNYLFVHEDGLIEQTEVKEVSVYCDSVAAGILEVIRTQNSKFESLQSDGSWERL